MAYVVMALLFSLGPYSHGRHGYGPDSHHCGFFSCRQGGLFGQMKYTVDWGVETIVHGDIVRSGASEVLRETLLGEKR